MDFSEKVSQYFDLLSKSKEEADKFYYQELLDDVSDRFKERVNEKFNKSYDYLIMTIGYSPEPLILWIRALKPKHTFFICDNSTLKFLDTIIEHTNLRPSQYQYQKINGLTITDVYKEIKDFVEKNELRQQSNKIVIDITGGKKSMVSGCTLAANYLGIDTVYVDYSNKDYNPKYRKPNPGSELPMLLEDPVEVFGDSEIKQAIAKFNSGDFSGSKDIFNLIRNRVANPKRYEMLEYLSMGYQALEAMNFRGAFKYINDAVEVSSKYRIGDMPINELNKQIKVLEPLQNLKSTNVSEKDIFSDSKLFWHTIGYNMAISRHYYNQDKSDLSALLTYRCLEMLTQYLLFNEGITASKAKYDHIENKEELKSSINKIFKDVIPNIGEYNVLPEKIGLMLGMVILKALNNTAVKEIDLNLIRNMTELRNKSRFAHGFDILAVEDVKKFYYNTEDIIGQVWKVEREKLNHKSNFDKFVEKFVFVKLS